MRHTETVKSQTTHSKTTTPKTNLSTLIQGPYELEWGFGAHGTIIEIRNPPQIVSVVIMAPRINPPKNCRKAGPQQTPKRSSAKCSEAMSSRRGRSGSSRTLEGFTVYGLRFKGLGFRVRVIRRLLRVFAF